MDRVGRPVAVHRVARAAIPAGPADQARGARALIAALVIAPLHSLWWAMLLVEIRPYDAMGAQVFGDALRRVVLSGAPLQLTFYCGVVVAYYAVEYYDKARGRRPGLVRRR